MTDSQPFTALQAADLGVALNEANLLAIEVDAETAAGTTRTPQYCRCGLRNCPK